MTSSKAENHASQTFGKYAQVYDADRRPLIPCFDTFYGEGLRLVADEAAGRALRVLDLGAGTGLFGSMALEALTVCELKLIDGSADMLERAKLRFGDDPRLSYEVADMTQADLGEGWDLVLSSLAIHHLSHDDKRGLYARIYRSLAPNGRFINAEQVLGPTPEQERRYRAFWEQDVRAAGVDDAGITAALDRQRHDIGATSSDQLVWLRDAGFTEVDCVFKYWCFAVLTGRA